MERTRLIVVGLALTVIVQFGSTIWFASKLDSRIAALESWMQKNDQAIGSLDLIVFRQQKIADLLEKVRDSQTRLELMLNAHMSETSPGKAKK